VQLIVNGEPHVVDDGLTIRALLDRLGFTDGPVAVEKNREVVPRAEHAGTPLIDGDRLEIVHLVGGG
jgi:sulfur carrier protein